MRDNGRLDNTREVTAPPGRLFVLGDNRDNRRQPVPVAEAASGCCRWTISSAAPTPWSDPGTSAFAASRYGPGCPVFGSRGFSPRCIERAAVTFEDVRNIALLWPEVEDGTSYGTPALKVRKKLLVRLREDGDSLVMPAFPLEESEHAGGKPATRILLHRPLPRLSDGADPPVEDKARHRRAVAAPAMARAGFEAGD